MLSNFVSHPSAFEATRDTKSTQIVALDSSLSASTHVAIATTFSRANVATWPVNSFLVCSLITQPLYARMSDDIGRKLPYASAVATFTFATALTLIGTSWRWLLLTRALCGVGIGGMLAMGEWYKPTWNGLLIDTAQAQSPSQTW
jgi:MFS family permease